MHRFRAWLSFLAHISSGVNGSYVSFTPYPFMTVSCTTGVAGAIESRNTNNSFGERYYTFPWLAGATVSIHFLFIFSDCFTAGQSEITVIKVSAQSFWNIMNFPLYIGTETYFNCNGCLIFINNNIYLTTLCKRLPCDCRIAPLFYHLF